MKENKKEYIIITVCPFCGQMHEIAVNEDDYWDWQDGMPVQDAFPYLFADDREMLISGICPICWEETFGDDEDEEEEDPEDWEDDVDETGFNPYLGSFDFDC